MMEAIYRSALAYLLLSSLLLIVGCSDGGSAPNAEVIFLDPNPEITGDFNRPAGIYLLGVRNSTNEIRDYPFVDGYVYRTGWGMLETAKDIYDFSSLDEFIEALDTIEQKLTLVVFSQRVPDYLLADDSVMVYETPNQNGTGDFYLTAVPWDETALARYKIFMGKLGDYEVMSLESGTKVALRDHPVISIIGVQIMGLGGLRDPLVLISAQQSYTREKFTDASLESLQIAVDEFHNKFIHMAFFGISDGDDNPELDGHVVANINERFNSGLQPKVGVFAENLACDTPGTGGNDYLFSMQDTTFTMFQMLQAWQDPFKNAERTDICNSATNGPDIAMEYGFNNFNARYFEVYPVDIDFEGYWDALQGWHDFLEGTSVLNE